MTNEIWAFPKCGSQKVSAHFTVCIPEDGRLILYSIFIPYLHNLITQADFIEYGSYESFKTNTKLW
jgi:hypothetical protein